jgi:hypothetical protein
MNDKAETVLYDGIAHGTPGPSQCSGHRGKELCRVKRVISRFVCCQIQPLFQAFLSRIVGKLPAIIIATWVKEQPETLLEALSWIYGMG